MAIDTNTPRTRRAVLTAMAASAGALVTHALGRPSRIEAATGDPLVVGEFNYATTVTTLQADSTPEGALDVTNAADGMGSHGVYGQADYGVIGSGYVGSLGVAWATGVGSYGSASDSDVLPPAPGGAGVVGQSDTGSAVVGFAGTTSPPAIPAYTGVYGRGDAGGTAGLGVVGYSAAGTVVFGQSSTGIAIRARGKVAFDRSGKLTIQAGRSYVTKTAIPLTTASMIFATLQQNVAGVYVQAAVANPAASSFTIYLNKVVAANTVVAWFVLS